MKKRNIVVILCDQLRRDFLKAYDCEAIPTPNIDRLAENGVVFDRAITQAPVCAPARACMMTGLYCSDHRVWTNDVPFRDDVEYIAERMNDLGYVTGAFGKLHHFPPDDSKGFQYVSQMEEGRLNEREEYLQWLKKKHPTVSSLWNCQDYKFILDEESYYEHWITSKTIEFFESHTKSRNEAPFLAWVAFQGPHTPLDPPSEAKGKVKTDKLATPIKCIEQDIPPVHKYRKVIFPAPSSSDDEVTAYRVAYAECIAAIDKQIGRIMEKLESLELMDNTTFIFSADHGDLLGDYGQNGKGPFVYQGQLTIPLIVSNHPDIKSGTKSDNLVGNIDIPATLLHIAGDESGIGVSRSLLDQAVENSGNAREVNFSEFCDSIKIVEDRRFRYGYYPFTGYSELYDLDEDPSEQHNLAKKPGYAQVEIKFLKHLIDYGVLCNGVHVNAFDFVPEQQQKIEKLHPGYKKDFKVAFPVMNREQLAKLGEAGLSETYNEFCIGKEILAHYGIYWEETKK